MQACILSRRKHKHTQKKHMFYSFSWSNYIFPKIRRGRRNSLNHVFFLRLRLFQPPPVVRREEAGGEEKVEKLLHFFYSSEKGWYVSLYSLFLFLFQKGKRRKRNKTKKIGWGQYKSCQGNREKGEGNLIRALVPLFSSRQLLARRRKRGRRRRRKEGGGHTTSLIIPLLCLHLPPSL